MEKWLPFPTELGFLTVGLRHLEAEDTQGWPVTSRYLVRKLGGQCVHESIIRAQPSLMNTSNFMPARTSIPHPPLRDRYLYPLNALKKIFSRVQCIASKSNSKSQSLYKMCYLNK